MTFIKGHPQYNSGRTRFKKGDKKLLGNKNGFKKGMSPWNKGKIGVYSEETLEKWSKKRKGQQMGENHPMWGKHNLSTTGEKNWKWKGGITPLDKKERTKFRQTIQKMVFERDNYTCKMCGTRGVHLQVDHIQPWAEYVELRFNMKNCRTLCQRCHYQITFGKPMSDNIKTWGHNLSQVRKDGGLYI